MAEFTDASLSPRARHMALWLCDLTNLRLSGASRAASGDMLLRELPTHWTLTLLVEASEDCRRQFGPKASHRAWLSAIGWLVGEEERLPPRPSSTATLHEREQARRALTDILAQLTPVRSLPTRGGEDAEAKRRRENAAWAASVVAAVQAQRGGPASPAAPVVESRPMPEDQWDDWNE